jgi:hypothetical protein
MTGYLKSLGLVLIAVLALGAMTASAALATHPAAIIAEEYPAFADGEELEKLKVTYGARTTTCDSYEGSASIEEASTTATVSGGLKECYTTILGTKMPITMTMNGCALVFHVTEETEPTRYTASTDLECPAGKLVETHIYSNAGNHASNLSLCTQTIPAQEGLKSVELTNVAGEPDYVIAHVNVTGMTSLRHGSALCGTEHGLATIHGTLKLSATNQIGEPIDAAVGPDPF